MILPPGIALDNVGKNIIGGTSIQQIAENAGIAYELIVVDMIIGATEECSRRVDEWLIHHMYHAPFHKLCYNSSIITQLIIDYLNEHGNDSALAIDTIHSMPPLHIAVAESSRSSRYYCSTFQF